MINFAPFIGLLLNKKRAQPKRELTEKDKKELEKINEMGLFETMDYLSKEEKTTYCGACGGDASDCDGC
jgi:predicted class III extradiol MEMO1 family dioxygenase